MYISICESYIFIYFCVHNESKHKAALEPSLYWPLLIGSILFNFVQQAVPSSCLCFLWAIDATEWRCDGWELSVSKVQALICVQMNELCREGRAGNVSVGSADSFLWQVSGSLVCAVMQIPSRENCETYLAAAFPLVVSRAPPPPLFPFLPLWMAKSGVKPAKHSVLWQGPTSPVYKSLNTGSGRYAHTQTSSPTLSGHSLNQTSISICSI